MLKLILTSSFLALSLSAQAASMDTPAVTFRFLSQDEKPVEGISLEGSLQYESLTTQDCSGWICMPSLPHYKTSADKTQNLGRTDSEGILRVAQDKWTAKDLTAKNLSLLYFSNGLATGVCSGSPELHPNDFFEVLPQYLNGAAVPLDKLCPSVEVLKTEKKDSIEMVCHSPYTSAEIEAMRAKVLSHCDQVTLGQ